VFATLAEASTAFERAATGRHSRFARIKLALLHARFAIATVALAYAIGLTAGGVMVHTYNGFALRYRDGLIRNAQQTSPILTQLEKGNRFTAACLDASGNAAAGLLSVIAGYGVPAAYWIAGSRGWVGGVVSVDDAHHSRLNNPHEAFYYLVTLLLQLIPYTLAGGAGSNLGFAAFGKPAWTGYHGRRVRWLLVPHEALMDAGWIYLIALPMFFVASLFEFLM
jgi:hypothetical protein